MTKKHPSPLILTLDIGTSSTRGMLFDGQGRAVPDILAQTPNSLRTTPDGGAEFEPEALLANLAEVIDQVLAQAGDRAGEIGGVALDSFVASLLGLDSDGEPVTPLLTYADTRSAAEVERLAQAVDPEAVHQRTGCLLHPTYWPAQLTWLARSQPDRFKQARRWLSIGEYVLYRLFGQRRVSYSVASWTGLLERHSLTWDQAWLAQLGLGEEQFSPLVDVDQPLRGLATEWAERWPALQDAPWFPVIGDGAAANLGSDCTGPRRVALTIGTSGAMRVALAQEIETVPAGLWLYRVNRTYGLLGGATSEGGNLFAWLNRVLQLPADLEQALAQAPPTAHGLTLLPFLAGERAPGWRGEVRAAISGLSLSTEPLDILRAGLEAVALRFALIQQRIAPHLAPDHQIVASGGALLSSPAWLQIMADVLGQPLLTLAEQEATSRGTARLALTALGYEAQIQPAATGRTYQPQPDHHARYQAALEAQVALYNRLFA